MIDWFNVVLFMFMVGSALSFGFGLRGEGVGGGGLWWGEDPVTPVLSDLIQSCWEAPECAGSTE